MELSGNESYFALRATLRQQAEDMVPRDEEDRDKKIRERPEWRAATVIADLLAQRARTTEAVKLIEAKIAELTRQQAENKAWLEGLAAGQT